VKHRVIMDYLLHRTILTANGDMGFAFTMDMVFL
jgi:hypothetical protein